MKSTRYTTNETRKTVKYFYFILSDIVIQIWGQKLSARSQCAQCIGRSFIQRISQINGCVKIIGNHLQETIHHKHTLVSIYTLSVGLP